MKTQRILTDEELAIELDRQYNDSVGTAHEDECLVGQPSVPTVTQPKTMINNPHWGPRLNEWLREDVSAFGMNLPLNKLEKRRKKNPILHEPFRHPPLDVLFPDHSYVSCMKFPTSNKYELLVDGFTVIPGVIPHERVVAAAAAINDILINSESFGASLEKRKELNEDPNFASGSTNHKDVLALFYQTPLYSLINDILHASNLPNPKYNSSSFFPYTHGAQVAYRFTEGRSYGARHKLGGLGWHIDGMEQGEFHSFSLLVGIPLSEQHEDFAGNLCVHPGSHYTLAEYLRTYIHTCIAVNGPANGDVSKYQEVRVPKPDLGEPVQVKAMPGDVVIALHRVAHRGGANYSQHVRKMVYFRVTHRSHNEHKMQLLDNVWLDFEGMQEVL